MLPSLPAHSIKQNGQQYFCDDRGQSLPSVSTILAATRPPEQWDALMNWRRRVGTTEANRISGTASRRGTGTHKQIQKFLKGEAVICTEPVRPYWDSIKSVLSEIDAVQLVEGTVFNYEWGYAGRVDCVASYQGIPCVCDWKTADRPKQSPDRLYDYPLQLVAYLGAVNHSYHDYGIQLDHALIAIALPDQPAEVFWFDADAIADYTHQWQQRVKTFWRRNGGYTWSSRIEG